MFIGVPSLEWIIQPQIRLPIPSDVLIAGAAADVAFQLVADGFFIQVTGAMAIDHVDRAHDHPWCTEAALQTVMLAESGLDRVQIVRTADAFQGDNLGAIGLSCQQRASLHSLAVHMNHTGSALRGVAAHMGSGQTAHVPDEPDQKRAVLHIC
jgi:hypothetical protein